ncbi:MAG: leucine-rich repeat domain-containing protein [Promethearchaeota archaeon]
MVAEKSGPLTFKINDLLELRLKNDKTILYVAGKPFKQCFRLMVINPHLNPNLKEINSIDDLDDYSFEEDEMPLDLSEWGITPEIEFWAHCSNLQAWYEHGYDTRLLHSNLSFPLLKELSETGDKNAKRIYKEEIAKRFIAGTSQLRYMLRDEGYLDIFTEEEIDVIYREVLGDEYDALLEIGKIIGKRLRHSSSNRYNCFGINNKDNVVNILSLKDCELPEFPEAIRQLKHLKELRIENCGLRELPEWICELKELEVLDLSRNCLERLPESICELDNLYWLTLSNNQLKHVHELKKGLNQLSTLQLGGNPIEIEELIDLIKIRDYPRRLVSLYGVVEKMNDGSKHVKRRHDTIAK